MMVLLCLHIRQWKNLETDRTCTTAVGSVLKKKVQNIMESCENEIGNVCLKNVDCGKSKSTYHATSSKSFKELYYIYYHVFPGILNVVCIEVYALSFTNSRFQEIMLYSSEMGK